MHKLLLEGEGNFRSVSREPMTAALLSLLPGAGQLYNGQSVKGILFMDVAVINFVLLWVVLFAQPMTDALRKFLLTNHVQPNDGVLNAVASTHLGAPFSFAVLTMVALFAAYAIRDAYDNATASRRNPIYANSVLNISEATSGSYLLHCASMFCFAILALFFLIPPAAQKQYTEIEFITNPLDRQKPPVVKRLSNNNSTAKGEHDTAKPKLTASRPAQPAHQAAPAAPAKSVTQPTKAPTPPAQPSPTPPRPTPPKPSAPSAPSTPAPPMQRPAPAAPPMKIPAPNPVPQSLQSMLKQAAPTPTPTAQRIATANPTPVALPLSPTGMQVAPTAQPVKTAGTAGGSPAPAAHSRGVHGAANGTPSPAPMPVGGGTGSQTGPSLAAPAPAAGPSHSTASGSSAGPSPTKVASISPGVSGLGHDIRPNVPKQGTSGGPEETSSKGEEKGRGKDGANLTKNVDFGAYMAELQRRIKRNWFPPKNPLSRHVVAKFAVSRSGELSGLTLVQSSGQAAVDQAALKAIEMAAPFRPLPEGADEKVDIQFTFDYNVFGGHATSGF